MRLIMYLIAAALLIVGSALTTHAVVQDDGLILYFSFDEADGSTVKDESGGGNDGMIDGADIVADEVVYGTGSLLCDEPGDSVSVESFQELEDYTDNSYLFWLNFTVANSGSWDQIIAKKAPGSDRSPGIWTCNRVSLHIHYRFNPGNAGATASALTAKVMPLTSAIGTILLVSKKVTDSSFTLMAKWLMNRLFRKVTRKAKRSSISVKRVITRRSSSLMTSISTTEHSVLMR